jgi:hypothetical protein
MASGIGESSTKPPSFGSALRGGGFADAVGTGLDLEFAVSAAGRGHEDRAAEQMALCPLFSLDKHNVEYNGN